MDSTMLATGAGSVVGWAVPWNTTAGRPARPAVAGTAGALRAFWLTPSAALYCATVPLVVTSRSSACTALVMPKPVRKAVSIEMLAGVWPCLLANAPTDTCPPGDPALTLDSSPLRSRALRTKETVSGVVGAAGPRACELLIAAGPMPWGTATLAGEGGGLAGTSDPAPRRESAPPGPL